MYRRSWKPGRVRIGTASSANLIEAVRWGEATLGREAAERAGLVVARYTWGYCCL